MKQKQPEEPGLPQTQDDDDELEHILTRIREQEDSEALALRLHNEWNFGVDLDVNTSSNTSAGSSSHDASRYDFGIAKPGEDDEALARRLAAEYADEGRNEAIPGPSKRPYSPDFPEIVQDTENLAESPGELNSRPLRTRSQKRAKIMIKDACSLSHVPFSSHSATEQSSPPDESLQAYRDLFTAVRKCTKCKQPVRSPRSQTLSSENVALPTIISVLHAYCEGCTTNHCRGCFKPVPCPQSCKGSKKGKYECAAMVCCAEVRAVALFEALGGFDRIYLSETTSGSRRKASAKRPSAKFTVGPGGTGYSIDGVSHIGPSPGTSTSATTKSATKWDQAVSRTLQTLVEFLPAPYSDTPSAYDMLPHSSIPSLLSLSYLPETLASLLRNDSVVDWTARSETYHAMLALLRRLADCEVTIELLISPGWTKKQSCGLHAWMWQDGVIEWDVQDSKSTGTSNIARCSPLYSHFEKLTKQCEVLLAGTSLMMEDENGDLHGERDMAVKTISLCGDIIAAREGIERAISVLKTRVPVTDRQKGKQKNTEHSMEQLYSAECERLAFKYVSLSRSKSKGQGLLYNTFNFTQELHETASSTRNPKDRLHLVKELAITATCLPPGVWVRVDDIRNDAIKVMIAGPEKTPYEGGLFEFDCFMPLEYPHRPPKMHLRTTGGGTVRFNPNLYDNGHVCLSLLGTWPGRPEEQWTPKSTLLQVLVSIQSMIFIDAPYFNEPGFGAANLEDYASKAYNRIITLQTTRWAIVDWLRDEHRLSIWADVIKSHFTIRKARIRERIVGWAAAEPLFGSHRSAAGKRRKASTAGGALDLVEQFDNGIACIEQWPDET